MVEPASMNVVLWIIGGAQAVSLLLLGWIKMDIKELWNRADKHGHVIECDGDGCKPHTKAVILPEGK